MKLALLAWLAGLLGFGLLVAGVAMINAPAAYIVAGLGLLAWSFLADRASAALKAQSKPQGG
ncbi:hypothetical protein DKY63_05725 [Pseudomonas putida]|uniref:Uncharacterized protein n=1 Tax=Pseudomonas putida TaxID=303 RepID=A0A2Z4REZ1_PSEPU|nr:hypothetical protein [Pseudomonas putida]AWY39429.1 hypothetical protein DKY63_05725 [Pseudomonas putida]